MISLQLEIPVLDALLAPYQATIGSDFLGYRNHCYRVFHYYKMFLNEPEDGTKVAIVLAFHDLGIWTEGNFNYLAPSIDKAKEYLQANNLSEWEPEIVAMIDNHHKRSPLVEGSACVEAFRKADWVDVTLGIRRFGISPWDIFCVKKQFPDKGFHCRLIQLSWDYGIHNKGNFFPICKD